MRKSLIIIILLFSCASFVANAQGWLDKAAVDGRVDSVRNAIDLPQEFTGKGVIIGVTDWGFDYTHPVFYDTNMIHYRVLRAWDQFKKSGPAPEGYDYGTEYIGPEQLLTAKCDTSNVYDYAYHGTHCAGIAGGAGAGTKYRGVAVDAEFLFVTVSLTDQEVIDAWRWMYDVAQQEGKRLVISMSWGLYYLDNMDGTGALADEMQRLSDLGVVFVSSAGNNGGEKFHISNVFTQRDTIYTQFTFPFSSIGSDITMMNNTPNTSFSFSVMIMDNSFNTIAQTQFFSTEENRTLDTILVIDTDTLRYSCKIESSNEYNNKPIVQLTVFSNSKYKFGLAVAGEEGEFHAWNLAHIETNYGNWGGSFANPSSKPNWLSGNDSYGISTPANADCAITVAAHSSRHQALSGLMAGGNIANFSSVGPGFGNTTKPDLSAPGVNVVSALSSYTNTYSGAYAKSIDFNGRTYRFVSLSGTSMSCPFVSGVAALILQVNPFLSAAQVKDILIQTAYNDQYTQISGPLRFGNGKVDAYNAVLAALQTVGVSQYVKPKESDFTIFPNPASAQCFITANTNSNSVPCEIFDISGRKVAEHLLYQGVNTLNISNLKSGYYIVKFNDGGEMVAKKLVVQ